MSVRRATVKIQIIIFVEDKGKKKFAEERRKNMYVEQGVMTLGLKFLF